MTVRSETPALDAPRDAVGLWYSRQGAWLALQTRTDGRTVRYEMRR